jgi:hypothetical protein
VLLNGEAQVWSEVQRAIVGVKPIGDLEAAREHKSSEVPLEGSHQLMDTCRSTNGGAQK